MNSILQDQKECYLTHAKQELHKHHIYGGKNRLVSEQNGFFVYLRHDWHVGTTYCVHHNPLLDKRLKQQCQQAYELTHSREEFMRLIGRNYL